MRKILLFGNPNVGKSAIFSRLTGLTVVAANYPGSTVEFTRGYMRLEGERTEVIDVPGTYSLEPSCAAEEVAVRILEESLAGENHIYVNVLDATNLERNLNLTLQLIEKKVPMVVVLNFWDETKHTGITIDAEALSRELGVPVITTCGVSGEGITRLVETMRDSRQGIQTDQPDLWSRIGAIVENVQELTHRHHTVWERLTDATLSPWTGLPIAVLVLAASFAVIRFIGESLIGYVLEPFFEKIWGPLVLRFGEFLGEGYLHDILIGRLIDGEIDFVESLGLLTTGLFVPLGMVLPYIIAFYLILSFLEDSGYLPRLGVLMDNFMHRVGVHGLAIIPMLLGIGCNVPGAMSTRILETRREKFIAATIMAVAVPCMAQVAMVFGLVGQFGAYALFMVFATLFVVWLLLGMILSRVIKGESPEIFIEIPPYRFPYLKTLWQKLTMRIIAFLKEAVPYVLLGVLLVNILYSLRIIDFIGNLTAPVVVGIMGLPKEAVGALIIGFLRKDVAVGMLVPLGLDVSQMIIAAVVLTMYFPCIATFMVMSRELGIKDMAKSAGIMVLSTLIVGGVLNLILP